MASTFIQTKEGGESIIEPSRKFLDVVLGYNFNSIIDFGCGYGCHVAEFAKAGRKAAGVDINFLDSAFDEARKIGYTLISGSWDELENESFDVGFSHHCLEHARDPIGWLHDWGKVVKPRGKLFLVVPAYRDDVVLAGHISIGFNPKQLAYMLAVAGWDCRNARIEQANGSIYAIVDRPENMLIYDTHVFGFGEAGNLMPSEMKGDMDGVIFSGNPEKIFY